MAFQTAVVRHLRVRAVVVGLSPFARVAGDIGDIRRWTDPGTMHRIKHRSSGSAMTGYTGCGAVIHVNALVRGIECAGTGSIGRAIGISAVDLAVQVIVDAVLTCFR